MKKEELIKLLLDDNNPPELVDVNIKHCESYHLLGEVLDFTEKFMESGDNVTTAFINAMYEWDL